MGHVKVYHDKHFYKVMRREANGRGIYSNNNYLTRQSAEALAIIWAGSFGLELLP